MAAVVWGAFCAPAARVPLPAGVVVVIKVVILVGAITALVLAAHPSWAVVLAVVAIASGLLSTVLPNPWVVSASS